MRDNFRYLCSLSTELRSLMSVPLNRSYEPSDRRITHFVVKIEKDDDITAYQAGKVTAPMVSLSWLTGCLSTQSLLDPAKYPYRVYSLRARCIIVHNRHS
jgi:hypothetical protein